MLFISLALIAASALAAGCSGGDEGCKAGEGAELLLNTNPVSGEAEANGNDSIRVTALGQDDNCKPFADGTPIEFRITDQDPDGVGYFSNDETTITVTGGAFGASTQVRSTVVGTAKVQAFSETYNLTAMPIDIEFTVPTQTGQCAVELSADPPFVPADGASTTVVTATLMNDRGGPMPDGTTVNFTTTLGEFTESGGQDHTTTTNNNTASATLKSIVSESNVQAEVTATFDCDDGKLASNTENVTFGSSDDPFVDLSASANEVLADNVSTVALTAEVFLPGGARAGVGEEVTFFTELGRFQESGGPTHTAYTDDGGIATATFVGGNQGGVAIVRASIFIDNVAASDEVEIIVRQLGFIEFVSATPDKLGVKGSGKNESSLITFQVKDTESNPFPAGALVEFTLSSAPGVTLDSPNDRTDNLGIVEATLNSGQVATTVTVTATAHVGTETLQAVSPPIAVVGAKPNARYITFSCERYTVGGFVLDFVETECTISLADRFSNKIGFATNVIFRTEAGAITSSAMTSEAASNMGMASVTIRTQDPRPKNVQPLTLEPRFVDGNNVTHNPRDGVVTILAATTGEEEFDDENGSGDYDVGEFFVDKGEPYVDMDDDGMRDPDEPFIDANDNLQYDGPNGAWDSDTLIWDVAYMLWTGEAAFANVGTDCGSPDRYSILCPDFPDSHWIIPKGGEMRFDWEVKDFNLNPLNATLRVDYRVEGKGSKGVEVPPLAWIANDTLGGFVNPTAYWEIGGGGFSGWFTVKGADVTDTSGPEAGTVTLTLSYNQTPGGGVRLDQSITSSGTFE
jgi:hypothetical protein